MKISNWVAYMILSLTILSIAIAIVNHNRSNPLIGYSIRDTTAIVVNPWEPFQGISVDDSINVYEVVWDQKYGVTKTAYCMAIFKNEKEHQYKLVAPWISSITIELQNTNDIRITKVRKQDVSDYRLCK